jgi:hypothetical protein
VTTHLDGNVLAERTWLDLRGVSYLELQMPGE